MPNNRIRVRTYRRTGRKFYTAEWTDPATGRSRTRSTGTDAKREVERFRVRLEDELNDPHAGKNPRVTWESFRSRVVNDFLPEKRPSTRERYLATMAVVEQRLNPKLLTGIRAAEIGQFKAACRAAGNTDATIAANLRHLKSLLRWAVEQGMLAKCPAIKIPAGETTSRGRALTAAEFQLLLDAVPKVTGPERADSWRHLLRGLWLSGLRISEAMELTWDDSNSIHVNLEAATLVIPGRMQKGRKTTVTPLTPDFGTFLREEKQNPQNEAFVFNPIPSRGDVRIQKRQIQATFTAIAKEAGVKATLHDLRRSFCSRWAKVLLPQHLMRLARHRSISTTLAFYANIDTDDTAEAIRRAIASTTVISTDT